MELDVVKQELKELVDKSDGMHVDQILERVCASLLSFVTQNDVKRLPWKSLMNIFCGEFAKHGWDFRQNQLVQSDFKIVSVEQSIQLIQTCMDTLDVWVCPINDHDPALMEHPETKEENVGELWEEYCRDNPGVGILRWIPPEFPRRVYRPHNPSTLFHWGQRKLLMSEIEFLTENATEFSTVLYVGAAPGNHIRILAKDLFPHIQFILIDPAPFSIQPSENIQILQDIFNQEMAKQYSQNSDLIFISDIRRNFMSEQLIEEDMQMQQEWHQILQPRASLLKFRLPWKAGVTKYLDGRIFVQPYAPPNSTETRLLVQGQGFREYNHLVYEQQCFFFNSVVRTAQYPHSVKNAGLDNSFDCAREVDIIREYIVKVKPKLAQRNIDKEIAKIAKSITKSLGGKKSFLWKKRITDSSSTGRS